MTARPRQEAILRFLRRNGSSTIAALAQEIGASRRTVLRDISALRDEGYRLHSDVGRGGGVQLDPHSIQATVKLSVPEVFALLISVAAMRAGQQLPFAGLADAGLAKIEKSLPADKVKDLRTLLDCLHIGQLSPLQDLSDMGRMEADLLGAFETSFLTRQHLRFTYCDAKGKRTHREVEPQAMLILPPLWYLVGWDPMREGFRHFRMDRISAPEPVANTRFRRRHVPFGDDICPYRALQARGPHRPPLGGA